jgi:transcriptional regulator with XRE-family HTH domain
VPVFSTVTSDYASQRIGERIREQRKSRGLTLKDVAGRLSISLATLSEIENNKLVLDIERLVAISQALGVPPEVLFPRSTSQHFEITRRDQLHGRAAAPLKVIEPGSGNLTSYHNLLRPIAPRFIGKHIEPFFIQVQPVCDEERQFICHHHEEFFFVLRGEVECALKTPDGLVTEVLGPGDCMYFWSYLPHCIRSTGPAAAQCVHLLYAAHGATESEFTDGSMAAVYFQDVSHKTLTVQIASKIRSLREARGMPAGEFAQSLGIGVRQLKDLEGGRRPVALDLLLRVCRELRKPPEYFLASTLVDRPFSYVLRASELASQPVQKRRAGDGSSDPLGMFKAMAQGFGNRGMYPYYGKLRPSKESLPTLYERHGQEFAYVLNGEVTLHTLEDGNRITERLSAGDSCFLDSTVPHRFVGVELSPYEHSGAEVINVFWCPLGENYLFEP